MPRPLFTPVKDSVPKRKIGLMKNIVRDVAKVSNKRNLQRRIPLSYVTYRSAASSTSRMEAAAPFERPWTCVQDQTASHSKGQLPLILISVVFFFIYPLHFHDFTAFPTFLSIFFYTPVFFSCYFFCSIKKNTGVRPVLITDAVQNEVVKELHSLFVNRVQIKITLRKK